MKNIIAVDYDSPGDWPFLKAMEDCTGEKWFLKKYICNIHGNWLQSVVRYLKYFIIAFKIFLNRKEYKTIVTWQQFYGIIYAFYCRFFRVRKANKVVLMTFIYKSKDGIIGKLYYNFVNYALTSGHIDKVIVFSGSEREYYGRQFELNKDIIVSAKLGIDEVDISTKSGKYYISAGRSNRDYAFLRKHWESINSELRIICDTIREDDTDNIKYLKYCHDENYLLELAGCYAVVISLDDENISSGQLVILQAKMFGKPVIVTDNTTVREYVKDGVDGYIIKKDGRALKTALKSISDPDKYLELSENSKKEFKSTFTVWEMGLRIGKIVNELYR